MDQNFQTNPDILFWQVPVVYRLSYCSDTNCATHQRRNSNQESDLPTTVLVTPLWHHHSFISTLSSLSWVDNSSIYRKCRRFFLISRMVRKKQLDWGIITFNMSQKLRKNLTCVRKDIRVVVLKLLYLAYPLEKHLYLVYLSLTHFIFLPWNEKWKRKE